MEPNVVSEEYLNLQTGIMEEQKKFRTYLKKDLSLDVEKGELNLEIPVLPQLTSPPVTIPLFREALDRISFVFKDHQPKIAEDIIQVVKGLTDEEVKKWIKGSITFNMDYFTLFSKGTPIEPSLLHFVAEQALRPFMQVLGEKCSTFINELDVMGTCPCCGEPPRLALLEEDGDKHLYCPRCETKWKQKKLQCVHCGDDRHENLFYVTIEEDATSKLEVCKTCQNYLKLVVEDINGEEKQATLLDLETIHLDFIAQQEGFGDSNS
ncbi:formate dehydrogenase accessory protein FdhE [Evansella tamaricis]|uniref:Formate dehydrogenase accessory protein FdhE n=1 Tax=Evansella tamaricis TaxID=2069301 RepID=A0ABS6JJR1_9BACI|nr:formate dehydrogenase accessory protein FdhE [Evansella tamaricis]MBU9713778.1 formate dehydrogenase accessory protein FdhE [Evansella tamaricis]